MCVVVSEGERLVFMKLMWLTFPYKLAVVRSPTSQMLVLTSETRRVVESHTEVLGCARTEFNKTYGSRL